MDDPVARMVKFLAEQRIRHSQERASTAWIERVPLMVPRIQQVVDVFQAGLAEPEWTVTVRSDLRRPQYSLAVSFDSLGSLLPGREDSELPGRQIGASAMFRCESDGIVYGLRFPFHGMKRSVRPERFADLGEPDRVHPDQIAHVVAGFLEWAAVGKGCGCRKLRFSSPCLQPAEEPMQLRIAA